MTYDSFKKGGDRCYRLAADETCLTVAEHGGNGTDAKLWFSSNAGIIPDASRKGARRGFSLTGLFSENR